MNQVNNAKSKTMSLDYAELADEEMGFVGRWYDKTVNGVKCKATISQGAEMFFKVGGTSKVALRLHSTAQQAPTIAVSVDGSEPVRMTTTKTGLVPREDMGKLLAEKILRRDRRGTRSIQSHHREASHRGCRGHGQPGGSPPRSRECRTPGDRRRFQRRHPWPWRSPS